jgi:tetratricopeptide (TPR) repeat protein
MWGYKAQEVARMLGMSVGQVRSYVRAGFLEARRGPRGELRFTFQDLVLLRATRELLAARVPSRRVKRALQKLRAQLPAGKPLAGVHIVAEGDQIVVREGGAMWQPESGQVLFDFEVSGLAEKVAPLVRKAVKKKDEKGLTAEDWYRWACDLEDGAPEESREAYRRALELDPQLPDAHVNLGRLLHEAGDLQNAEVNYRSALELRPDDAIAAFNLGVVLEDLKREREAVEAYELAVKADPQAADAHFNAARIYEKLGQRALALRHLGAYRKLTRG